MRNVSIGLSMCVFLCLQTPTSFMFTHVHIYIYCGLSAQQYVSLWLKILVNLDLTVCGSSLKTSALLQLTLSAAND